jgi:hypothetical protein
VPHLQRRKDIQHLSCYCLRNRVVQEPLTGYWQALTDMPLSDAALVIVDQANALLSTHGSTGNLSPCIAELHADALITRRIPPQPDFGALLYGFRVYGEG